ncbi:hypothetical protein D0N36_17000 [Hymenobacter lapidiphilus]|uniref:hypothetical protein n=1 Tax=Hymenobacter sp. CCM 8763 TaxID=2303334 RepID=UPI000E349CEB|nr:hypothetical protein [Hymenobacter sp. CCM 8763]RFP63904.1 hypothetical protein D0N36_17000 [Hymenobacter sp. CCM 8763]
MLKFLEFCPACRPLILTLLAGLAGSTLAHAQLDNRAFLYRAPLGPSYEHQLRLEVQGFLFNKDNEYFNKIDPGLTYFGAQLAPRLVYYPAGNLRLEAGVFLWKNYGTPQLRQVRPLFTLKYRQGPHTLLFGNLEGNLHHGYIEPLFDFERVIINRLEEGMQYQLQTPRTSLDAWVNWVRQQYRFSNFQEEVAGGLTLEHRLLADSARWLVALPFQFTATHRGGQIDTIDKPLQTLFNGATGLRVRRGLSSNLVRAVHFDGYLTYFNDYSFTEELPFKSGTGIYLNVGADTRLSNLQVAYWSGKGYISPLGGRLYQSVSSSAVDVGYTERQRQLLILRVLRDYRLPGQVILTTRFEPLYDLNNGLFDFSFALYLNFNQSFLLTTLRPNR